MKVISLNLNDFVVTIKLTASVASTDFRRFFLGITIGLMPRLVEATESVRVVIEWNYAARSSLIQSVQVVGPSTSQT